MTLSTSEILDRAVARGDFADITEAAERERAEEQAAADAKLAEEQAAATADLDSARAAFIYERDRRHEVMLDLCDRNESYVEASDRYQAAKRQAHAAGVPETTPALDTVTQSRASAEYDLRKQVERIAATLKAGV